MDNQVRRGLGDLVSPLTINLADAIPTPGLKRRTKKSKRRERQALSSESSTEKPPKNKPRMNASGGQVSSVVNQSEGTTAGTNDMMNVAGQQSTGLNGPPGNHPVRAGNKGEQFVREFCKMNPVKRAIRDDKDEKA